MGLDLLAWGERGWGDEMLRGAGMTLLVALSAYALALLFGAVGAAAKLSRARALRFIGQTYTTIFRGIPELLVIYLVFFGGDGLVTVLSSLFGYQGAVKLPLFFVGVFAIALCSGAYCTEVMRGAIQAVPTGVLEAAKALGLDRWTCLLLITMPLALRIALPGLANVLQIVLKETALISVIGLVELMRQAGIASGSTREPFTFYLVAALLYWCLTLVFQRVFVAVERSVARP